MTGIGENSGEARSVGDYGSIGHQIMNGRVVQESAFFDSIATRDQELVDAYVVPAVMNDRLEDPYLLDLSEPEIDQLTRLEQKVDGYSKRLWRQYLGEPPDGKEDELNLTMYKRDIMVLLLTSRAVSIDALSEAYELTEEATDMEILKTALQDVKKFVNNGCRHINMGVLATEKA